MKSNRIRPNRQEIETLSRVKSSWMPTAGGCGPLINLESMAAPVAIERAETDQIIEDILIATLLRVQKSAKGELAAAAARYVTLLQEKAV
jgi:hypothetical protein